MNFKKLIPHIIICLSAVALFGFARLDDDPIKKIVAALDNWTTTAPQEKVYLQTDKPYYAAGEDLWFKSYITVGPLHQLSAVSKVLYVELIDERDSIKTSLRLPVYAGTAWGDIKLPDSLKAGNYRLRGYTNYMRNAGPEYFFDKTFVIGNGVSNQVFTKTDYKYSTNNGQQKINAMVTYASLDGKPYANKEVSFDVQFDGKGLSKGKGLTDANGIINIGFVKPAGLGDAASVNGNILTKIKLTDKTVSNQTIPIKALSDKIDLQFFPEGGNLITGLRSKVAFKATGADGLGQSINAVITDNENNEIAKLNNQHAGMGLFALLPEAGKTYKAELTNADGSKTTIPLPQAMAGGYTLGVINTDPENLTVKIGAGTAQIGDGPQNEISIVAQQSGRVYFAAKIKMTGAVISTTVPKNKFPSGIVQFTLFSSSGEPLNERLTFIQNPDQLKLDVNTEKATSTPRQKVKINLTAATPDNHPATGSFSVAVIDEGKVPVDETAETTLLSHILLTSDIKGYIEKPNYYFTNINDQTKADLDLLMLTQGYRRFVWKQILSAQPISLAYQPEKSIAISGTMKNNKGLPLPQAKVTLMATKGGMFLQDTVADEQGRFAFNNLAFGDSVMFVIQGRTNKDRKNVKIALDNTQPQPVTRNKNLPDLQVDMSTAALAGYLKDINKQFQEESKFGTGEHGTMLKNVTIKEKYKPLVEYSANLNGPGAADVVLKVAGKVWADGCPVFIECLSGRLAGVRVVGGIPYMAGGLQGFNGASPMLVIIDGVQISDLSFLRSLSSRDVQTVEVLRTVALTSIYGVQGGNGVLIITSKKGGGLSLSDIEKYAPGVINYSPQGYYKVREFYSPQYDDPKTNTQMADLRSTIFWKPSIITDKEGKASFEYFNADAKGTYRVVVEGIDGAGNLGRQVFRYQVQ